MGTDVRKYMMILVCLLSGLISGTLLAAQTVAAPNTARAIGFARYNRANEIVLSGTVQEVITAHRIGSPPGMHLLVKGPQGTVDTHVGPFLAKDVQAALQVGTSVKIIGAMELLHGRQYLLVSQLDFNGRVVNVRSSKGFLVRAVPTGTSRVAPRTTAQNSGER